MKKDTRPFWFGLGIGLFIFLTGAGLLTVDYQGRKMSFGDTAPLAQLERFSERTELTVKAFGREESWDITPLDKLWGFLCDFSCLPHDQGGRKVSLP